MNIKQRYAGTKSTDSMTESDIVLKSNSLTRSIARHGRRGNQASVAENKKRKRDGFAAASAQFADRMNAFEQNKIDGYDPTKPPRCDQLQEHEQNPLKTVLMLWQMAGPLDIPNVPTIVEEPRMQETGGWNAREDVPDSCKAVYDYIEKQTVRPERKMQLIPAGICYCDSKSVHFCTALDSLLGSGKYRHEEIRVLSHTVGQNQARMVR